MKTGIYLNCSMSNTELKAVKNALFILFLSDIVQYSLQITGEGLIVLG